MLIGKIGSSSVKGQDRKFTGDSYLPAASSLQSFVLKTFGFLQLKDQGEGCFLAFSFEFPDCYGEGREKR